MFGRFWNRDLRTFGIRSGDTACRTTHIQRACGVVVISFWGMSSCRSWSYVTFRMQRSNAALGASERAEASGVRHGWTRIRCRTNPTTAAASECAMQGKFRWKMYFKVSFAVSRISP